MIVPDTRWWDNYNLSFANPDIYGPVVGGAQVQAAMYKTLQSWMPAYTREFNRQNGGDILSFPLEYKFRPEYRALPKNPFVAVLVEVPGTTEEPQRHESGAYWACYKVQVSLYLYGTQDWQESQALTQAYVTVVRAAVLQHKDLMGTAQTVMWKGEVYAEKQQESLRTIGIGAVDFDVTVYPALIDQMGPPLEMWTPAGSQAYQPSLLAPPDAIETETYNITIENELP